MIRAAIAGVAFRPQLVIGMVLAPIREEKIMDVTMPGVVYSTWTCGCSNLKAFLG